MSNSQASRFPSMPTPSCRHCVPRKPNFAIGNSHYFWFSWETCVLSLVYGVFLVEKLYFRNAERNNEPAVAVVVNKHVLRLPGNRVGLFQYGRRTNGMCRTIFPVLATFSSASKSIHDLVWFPVGRKRIS